MSSDVAENTTFEHTEPDVVIKPDGRYLVYYSWPGIDCEEPEASAAAQSIQASVESLGGLVRSHGVLRVDPPMSELRWNPQLGEWVITATHRQDRTFLPPKDFCPLCPTSDPAFPTEIERPTFDVAVFENRFPSLRATQSTLDRGNTTNTCAAFGRRV